MNESLEWDAFLAGYVHAGSGLSRTNMSDRQGPPSPDANQEGGGIRARLRPRVSFRRGEEVHTFDRNRPLAGVAGGDMSKLNSDPKRDPESVGLPPLKQPAGRTCTDSTGMDSGSGEKPEGTKVVVSGKIPEGSGSLLGRSVAIPRAVTELEDDDSSDSMPDLEVIDYNVDVSAWVLVPDVHLTPVLGSVAGGGMSLLREELDSTLTSEENSEDSQPTPLREVVIEESNDSPGEEEVRVPFRVEHPPAGDPVQEVQQAADLPGGVVLEVEAHTNLQTETEIERLRKERLFEETRASLKLEKERDKLRKDKIFEEESLKKIVEERKQLEQTFLGKRSAALGEHKASLAFMNQLTLKINELEKQRQLVWEETKSLNDKNNHVGSIIMNKQLEVANFETLLSKQSVKFNSLKQSIEELEVRLATARSLSTSDHAVEDSGEGTFETATDGSPKEKDTVGVPRYWWVS